MNKVFHVDRANVSFMDTVFLSLPLSLIISLFTVFFFLKPFYTTFVLSFVSPYNYQTGIPVVHRVLVIEPIFYVEIVLIALLLIGLTHIGRLFLYSLRDQRIWNF